jgi:hypothetical protein
MDATYQILRYLKSTSGKGLIFLKNDHSSIDGYCNSDWASYVNDRRFTSRYHMFIEVTWSLRRASNS